MYWRNDHLQASTIISLPSSLSLHWLKLPERIHCKVPVGLLTYNSLQCAQLVETLHELFTIHDHNQLYSILLLSQSSRTLHHPWPQPALFDPPSVSVFLGPDLYRIGLLISSSPTEPYPSLHHASGMICRLNSASFIFPLPRPGERGSRVCCSGARFHRRGPGYTKFLKIYSDLTKNVSILSILG